MTGNSQIQMELKIMFKGNVLKEFYYYHKLNILKTGIYKKSYVQINREI